MPTLFVCFFLSGFAGLLYQTVWMRLALAHFGVNTSVIATVLTVFMLGLALGTYAAGRWAGRLESRWRIKGLALYACLELIISAGGWLVPSLFAHSRMWLLQAGSTESLAYSAASTLLLSAALLPFCMAMGGTFPAAMSFIQKAFGNRDSGHSFSFLYLANVAGALAGVLLTSLILIECLGFRTTLHVAAGINGVIALLAYTSTLRTPAAVETSAPAKRRSTPLTNPTADSAGKSDSRTRFAAIFLTGFCSMGMEVVWTRIYTPFIGTFVYSFAGILAVYLVFTAAGSFLYRYLLRRRGATNPWTLWFWLCLSAMFPFLSASVHLSLFGPLRIIAGIGPFCAVLGYLTPALLDEETRGIPEQAGRAYSVNLLGCMMGPLLAGFVLIPLLGSRWSLLLLAIPLFLFIAVRAVGSLRRPWLWMVLCGISIAFWYSSVTFEDTFPAHQIRHDHTATVTVAGEGMRKRLFVNGFSITHLTPITKMMLHFPMAHLDSAPAGTRHGLVICLGMGTSFRSLLSWGVQATAVELVPSVPDFFPYFFPDAPVLMGAGDRPVKIVIDDGRRYLDRTEETFDLITLDPPPPVEAAGSSMLYSKEFYQSAIRRLKPGGILHTWLPAGDVQTVIAVTRSLQESFPHLRAFPSMEGWGVHYLASLSPIPKRNAVSLLGQMPPSAVQDMIEWNSVDPASYFQRMLEKEIDLSRPVREILGEDGPALTDDRPVNEFFFARRYLLTRR